MRILVVDDEYFAIQGIMNGVNWEVLPYEEILQANSYGQWSNWRTGRWMWCSAISRCRTRAAWS